MKTIHNLKLHILEGSEIEQCICAVVRTGIAGPDSERRFWIVRTEPQVFVKNYPPVEYLIIGPAGRDEKLEMLQEGVFEAVGIQVMLDTSGRAPEMDAFDWRSVYDFGRGMAIRLDA